MIKENIISSKNLIEDYLIGNVTFYISGPLWKRIFLEKQNQLFDESLTNLDDWDFNLQMLYQKPNITYVNEVLILYRIHGNSLSQEIGKCNFKEVQSEFEARRKHILFLMFKKNISLEIFKKFIVSRNKYFLREALLAKNNHAFSLFLNLLLTQVLSLDFKGLIRSFLGYFGLKFFKRGYNFFK